MKSRFGIGLSILGLALMTAFQNCAGGLPENIPTKTATTAPEPTVINGVTFSPASVVPGSPDPLNVCGGTWIISTNNQSGSFSIQQRASDGEFIGTMTLGGNSGYAIQGACTSTDLGGHMTFTVVLAGASQIYSGDWVTISTAEASITNGTWSQQNVGQGTWAAKWTGK